SGMKDAYVRRRRGEERCDLPPLERLLPRTHGVLLYQEDVLRAAWKLAGLSLERADQIRRALQGGEAGTAVEREFRRGALRNGLTEGEASRLWDSIRSFVAFSYSKAHAATYGRISYQALHLKAHHPAAFLAAVMANGGGFYDGAAYLEEARRLGVKIRLPDINRSAETEVVEEGAIRIGLGRVRDLRADTLRAIEGRRPFLSLTDFLGRVPEAQRRETEHLVLTGCFDAFDGTRPEKLWRVLLHDRDADAPPELFGTRHLLPPERTLPAIREYSPQKAVELEQELLGLTPTAHPLVRFRRGPQADAIHAEDLERHVGRRVSIVGWVITTRRIRTRAGEPMKFVSVEDETGVVEVTFPAAAYRRCAPALVGRGPLRIRGRVQDHLGAAILEGQDAEVLRERVTES
ncbi:MAG: OB-fold nucleic acid binding domain-containing protein, partial [Planctomycetota bacterium]